MIIKEKYLMNSPVLYRAIIKDLVEEGKYPDIIYFINEAIKEKIIKEGIDMRPKTNKVYENIYDIEVN